MACPICKSEKVEGNASNCPECESDLTTFALLDDVSKEKSNMKRATGFLVLLTLLTLGGWAFSYYNGMADSTATVEEAALPDNLAADEIDVLQNTLAAKEEEITKLNNKLAELHATIESSANDLEEEDASGVHKLHIVKEGESLWSISELYHGHGFKHHHIAGHNELGNPNHIEVGDTLVIQN
jgi:nucleoid-associated protein YgaU